jgi:signal transduction histidine kinase
MTASGKSCKASTVLKTPGNRLDGAVLRAGLLLAVAMAPVPGLADELFIDQVRYVITDTSSPPGEQADWQPYQVGQALGFVEDYVWLRLRFPAPAEMPDDPWLLIRPVHLDEIAIYRHEGSFKPRLIVGDRQPTAGGIVPSSYALTLTNAEIANGLLIRFDSHNLMQPHLKVRAQAALHEESTAFYLLVSVAIAATLFYLLWAVSAMISSPTPLVAAFIARLSLYLLTLLIHTGLTRPLFGEAAIVTQDFAHNLTALTYITFAQIFDYMLLREVGRRWATRLFASVVIVSFAVKILAFGLNNIALALQVNNASALATLVLALTLIPVCRSSNTATYDIKRATLAIYFLLQALPLALLFAGTLIEIAWFDRLLEFSFANYAVLPGAYIAWILFRRQHAIVQQRNTLVEQSRLLRARSKEQRQRRKEMGELLEMLSHEVRTPLATLRLAHHMDALDSETVGRATQAIDHALRQADRVEELDRGRLQVRPQPVELGALVDALADERGVDLKREGGPAIAQVDPELLRVVLSNLISNAGKYGLPSHPVMVSIEQGAGAVTLRVYNRVEPGTEPDARKAFDKYYRAESASGQSGTGLGLYIVGQLSERMGIEAELSTRRGRVSVILSLPSPASDGSKQSEEDHDAHRNC